MYKKVIIDYLDNSKLVAIPAIPAIPAQENRDLYLEIIEKNLEDVFSLGKKIKLSYAPELWEVRIGGGLVELRDFLAIGTTREIGDRNDPLFYQFKHPPNEKNADISRVHCVLHFFEEFVVVVDLWSYHGTQVTSDGGSHSSTRGNRKIIKITDSGIVSLINCYTAKDIYVKRKKVDEKQRDECVICMDNKNTHIILPCAHKCVCFTCAQQKLVKCPICRAKISEIKKVY